MSSVSMSVVCIYKTNKITDMKTMTKKEFYEELERERKGAVRIMAIGVIACVVLIVSFVLLLLANGEKEPKETKYVEQIMIA